MTTNHNEFSRSVLEFLENYQFDGVEINWNTSIIHLKQLLRSLYHPLTNQGYSLAVALKPDDPVDAEIADYTDMIILQAWHNRNHEFATYPAPLELATSLTKKWTDSGINPAKIILGVPFWGYSYTLKFRNLTNAGSPVIGPGLEGAYTKHRGILAYYEICEKTEDLWQAGRDKIGSYLKRGDQWIGYEDNISVKVKAAFVRSKDLGGVSLSFLDLDDALGICGEPWPLLYAATNALGIFDSPAERCYKEGVFSDRDNCAGFWICEHGRLYKGICDMGRFFNHLERRCVRANPGICSPGLTQRLTDVRSDLTILRAKQKSQKLRLQTNSPRVVCYVTSWASYRKGDGKFVPEHLDTRLCTDVIYAFAALNPDTLMIQPFDPWADIDNSKLINIFIGL